MEESDKSDQDDSSDGDPVEDPYGLPEARSYDKATEPRPYAITALTTSSLLITTTRWRYAWCDGSTCPVDSQHTHMIFDVSATPKADLRTFNLHICQNKGCEEKATHTHYPKGMDNILKLPTNLARQVQLLAPFSEDEETDYNLDMIIQQLGTVETRIDERGNDEYLAETFNCIDTKCPEFYNEHHYVFNIDPRYLGHTLSALKFMRLLKRQGACDNTKCEWKENKHIHFKSGNDQGKDR